MYHSILSYHGILFIIASMYHDNDVQFCTVDTFAQSQSKNSLGDSSHVSAQLFGPPRENIKGYKRKIIQNF